MSSAANPFPHDPDRGAIWDLLVEDDITGFLARDWSRVAPGFREDGFTGHVGAARIEHWRIGYPTLASYRDDWLDQAARFRALRFRGETGEALLRRATQLRDIEIAGDRATARKSFFAEAVTLDGEAYPMDWITLYHLRREGDAWRITGFLGYLPREATVAGAPGGRRGFSTPASNQHTTAGPYSPSVAVSPGRLLVLSGQGPIDLDGHVVGDTIEAQTAHTLANCRRLLADAGAGFADVFQVKVYLRHMSDWAAFNAVYAATLAAPFPARTAIQAELWGGILVEIDMTANVD